jgi:hypothetical protein
MFERYTEKARRVVFFSRYEDSQYGAHEIDCEHILLGLVREARTILTWTPGLTADAVRRKVEEYLPHLPSVPTTVDMPLSPDARDALEFAGQEADRLGQKHVGTEHLLLGLLGVNTSFSAKLLRESGANPATIREKLAGESRQTNPQSFQRASFYDRGFRTLSAEVVEIHGSPWNVDYIRDGVRLARAYNWHWHKATWKPRDVVIHRQDGTCSFELLLAGIDSEHFKLVRGGWKKDHCFVCHWDLFESDDEHGTGYTNGHDWLCTECYERFWQDPGFFASAYSEIT